MAWIPRKVGWFYSKYKKAIGRDERMKGWWDDGIKGLETTYENVQRRRLESTIVD